MNMYDKNNIFAKIIAGTIPAKKIYEDEKILAIHDINPVAPIHVLVIPKGEYIDYSDFVAAAATEDIKYYFTKIVDIVKVVGLEESGYRLITNKGSKSGQTVPHFHTHIIGGKNISGLIGG